jgi:hypothetical protein
MLRPAITRVEEPNPNTDPHSLIIAYHSSVPHTFTFSVSDPPWEDTPVAACEAVEQDSETVSLSAMELPEEVRDEVESRGYTIREA